MKNCHCRTCPDHGQISQFVQETNISDKKIQICLFYLSSSVFRTNQEHNSCVNRHSRIFTVCQSLLLCYYIVDTGYNTQSVDYSIEALYCILHLLRTIVRYTYTTLYEWFSDSLYWRRPSLIDIVAPTTITNIGYIHIRLIAAIVSYGRQCVFHLGCRTKHLGVEHSQQSDGTGELRWGVHRGSRHYQRRWSLVRHWHASDQLLRRYCSYSLQATVSFIHLTFIAHPS